MSDSKPVCIILDTHGRLMFQRHELNVLNVLLSPLYVIFRGSHLIIFIHHTHISKPSPVRLITRSMHLILEYLLIRIFTY